jgi:2TM domain
MAAEQDELNERDEQYQEAKRRVEARKGFYVHAFFFGLINIICLAVVGWDFLWATVFWGLGLVLHGASVFFSASDWVKSWEHRAIQKELARQRGAAPTTGTRRTPPTTPPPAADATQPNPTPPRADAAEKKT